MDLAKRSGKFQHIIYKKTISKSLHSGLYILYSGSHPQSVSMTSKKVFILGSFTTFCPSFSGFYLFSLCLSSFNVLEGVRRRPLSHLC